EIHLGRNDSNYIIIKDQKVNKKHAKIINYRGEVKIFRIDSKSEIFINGKSESRLHILKKNDEIKIGCSTFRYLPAGEFKDNNDPLLQIYNTTYLQKRLEDEFKNNKKLCLMFFDLDFKEIEDDVLKELTMLIQNEHLNDKDIFSKYEEKGFTRFVILLIDTCLEAAHEIAKEIRSAYLFNFKEKKLQSITLSIGISGVNSSVKTFNDLLIHTKEACVKAKEYDHNQVVIWENEEWENVSI
ncbi:9497_t:CDS:1, partial [Dentiscutata heterogama]